ncbi:MAG: lysozyme inhibitor LprI family protein [Mycobacteriaceae bacterium]
MRTVALPVVLLVAGCTATSPTASPASTSRSASASATASAAAGTPAPRPSGTPHPEELCGGNTQEMAACQGKVLDALEHQMQRTYDDTRRALMAAKKHGDFTVHPLVGLPLTVDPSAELRQAPYAFLAYRTKMCGAEYDAYIQESIRVLVGVECQIDLTRRQIAEIQAMTGPG